MSEAAGAGATTQAPRGSDTESVSGAHRLALTVWDVPSSVGTGERFALTVGARCSAGCDLGGRELTLVDQHGAAACRVALGRTVWPGTEALYVAQAEAIAPFEAGTHAWEAKMAGWNGESPHVAGSFPLAICVVAAPDCEVTVKVMDRASRMPIANARVVMHPYRAVTDRGGMARVKVGKGEYDLLVSAHRYLPSSVNITVNADMVANAVLDADHADEEGYE